MNNQLDNWLIKLKLGHASEIAALQGSIDEKSKLANQAKEEIEKVTID